MYKFLIVSLLSMFAAACAASGGTASSTTPLDIKAGAKATKLEIKASGTDKTVKTFTDKAGKVNTATSLHAIVANHELDAKNFGAMRKPVTAADQVKLAFQLIGAEGTDQNAELKPGIYKADPKELFMKVDFLSMSSFADGKAETTNFDTNFSTSKITGQIEVTSVTADAITGNIDVTDGDKSVKGPFTAKITKK
jgi:hypothetical protein